MVINATAVTIAMYCLIEFYRNLKDHLASHRPFLKLLCIKLVIFLSFWQTVSYRGHQLVLLCDISLICHKAPHFFSHFWQYPKAVGKDILQ